MASLRPLNYFITRAIRHQCKRTVSSYPRYTSDSKSSDSIVDVLKSKDNAMTPVVNIEGHGDHCLLVNGTIIYQPVIAFRETFVLWDVKSYDDISIDSLAIVSTHFPTVEVLFIGVGNGGAHRFDMNLMMKFRKLGTVVEMSSTFHAASTFNVLVAEGRNVAVALIPESHFKKAT